MTRIWAHRGASGYAPENTLAAFSLAHDQLADGVELDVQLSADGELIVIHDETLDRTTSGHGWVKDHTLDQIKTLDASLGNEQYPGEKVPTLGEVFDLLSGTSMLINVEIKDSVVDYPGIAEKVLDLVDDRDWEYRTVISSFNHMTLAHIRQVGSLVSTGVLFQDVLYEPWNYAHQLWATALHPPIEYVKAVDNLIAEAHNSLLEVNAWTVNEVEDIDAMLRQEVDGIITNYPDRVRARIEALGLD
ncbi:MAG: glycerophosphodiester phosphodiesterase [Propionibacteriaceae bacterium]|jgi:glycerophosphoryl diester phosphodiesterase|nr:glycerophosphodiester phosphodiesterase [Propionibacteriaceae bacterium]